MVLKKKKIKLRVWINLVSLKISAFPLEVIEVVLPFTGPGFQSGAGAFRSISQYFLENNNTDETGKR